MIPWRTFMWAGVALALVLHLAGGVAGPDANLCICSNGIVIAPQDDACCDTLENADPEPSVPSPCDTDCHLIPLPDGTATETSAASVVLPVVDLPAASVVAHIVWPDPARGCFSRPRRHPPDPALHRMRSVVLIC